MRTRKRSIRAVDLSKWNFGRADQCRYSHQLRSCREVSVYSAYHIGQRSLVLILTCLNFCSFYKQSIMKIKCRIFHHTVVSHHTAIKYSRLFPSRLSTTRLLCKVNRWSWKVGLWFRVLISTHLYKVGRGTQRKLWVYDSLFRWAVQF